MTDTATTTETESEPTAPATAREPSPAGVTEVGASTALRRHPLIVIVTLLLFVGAAAAAGFIRKPVWTAAAKLSVGGINLSAAGALSGYSQATQALASAYARAIDATAVVVPAARITHLPATTVQDRLSATPVALSPVFIVNGTGPTAQDAITLTNAGSNALITYITGLNRSTTDASRLFGQLGTASHQFENARRVSRKLQTAALSAKKVSPADSNALVDAATNLDLAGAKLAAVRQTYVQSLTGQSSTSTAELLSAAGAATSDRLSKLEILLFVGVIAGLVVGSALAILRERRKNARALS